MDISLIVGFICGLGFFSMGLNFLSLHLKKIATNKIRKKIAKLTTNPFLGVLSGGVFSVITQSGSALAFILVGMARSGMIKLMQAFLILIGANLFAGLAIFIFTFNVKLGVLLILGLSGMLYANAKKVQISNLSGILFGIGLLFLGLNYMQEAFLPLISKPEFSSLINYMSNGFFLSFILGGILSIVFQSSLAAILVIMIPLAQANHLGINEAVMFVYGTCLGSSVLIFILSLGLVGESKQIAMFQVLYNIIGALILIPIFYIEYYLGVPLIIHLVGYLSEKPAIQISFVYLIFNVAPTIVILFMLNSIFKIAKIIWPQPAHEELSKTFYIKDMELLDTSTGLNLIELEQIRLIEIFGHVLAEFRKEVKIKKILELYEAFESLSIEILDAIKELSNKSGLISDDYNKVNNLLSIHYMVIEIIKTLKLLDLEVEAMAKVNTGALFSSSIIEGIDSILLTLIDVAKNRSELDFEFLKTMTTGNSKIVVNVRKNYISQESFLILPETKLQFLAAANHVDHIIWMLGKLGQRYMSLEPIN